MDIQSRLSLFHVAVETLAFLLAARMQTEKMLLRVRGSQEIASGDRSSQKAPLTV